MRLLRIYKSKITAVTVNLRNILQSRQRILSGIMLRYTVFAMILISLTSVHCARRTRREVIYKGLGVSPGQQCRDNGYYAACKADPVERCTQLKCTYKERGDIPTYDTYDVGPAKQGTLCGANKICVAAKCVDNPTPNPINVKSEEEYDCIPDSEYEDDEIDP